MTEGFATPLGMGRWRVCVWGSWVGGGFGWWMGGRMWGVVVVVAVIKGNGGGETIPANASNKQCAYTQGTRVGLQN